jgi:D-hydroxyproline dehydrogenase subunit gamma
MPSEFTVRVNGDSIVVPVGSTVAVAIAIAGQPCRTSVTGEPRGPLCGMGICFECRAVVDGIPHSRTCQILCEPDMDVSTNE